MNILFLCTGNSCRSQMAEGFCRFFHKDIQAFSAGIQKSRLNPYAIQVMNEVGIDISKQTSKTIEDIPKSITFDFVVTVCDHAHQNCPVFPGTKTIHVGFDDPPHLTKNMNNDTLILSEYRRVRDEIKSFIKNLKTDLK